MFKYGVYQGGDEFVDFFDKFLVATIQPVVRFNWNYPKKGAHVIRRAWQHCHWSGIVHRSFRSQSATIRTPKRRKIQSGKDDTVAKRIAHVGPKIVDWHRDNTLFFRTILSRRLMHKITNSEAVFNSSTSRLGQEIRYLAPYFLIS